MSPSMSNSSSSSLSLSSFSSSDGGSGKKLSFLSLPAKFEPPGTETPPLETSATVPFRWEEAPGRPRAGSNDTKQDQNDKKCLDLPPRLLLVTERRGGRRITNMPSPTTVLDGPDLGRSVAYGVSFRSFRSPESFVKRERAGYFGSSRWGGSFGKNNVVVGNGADFLGGEGIIDFSSSVFGTAGDGENVCEVKIPKNKKGTKSHIWGSIYGSLKQIVPWKRRERARK